MRFLARIIAPAALAGVVLGCGGGAPSTAPSVAPVQVEAMEFKFTPDALTIPAGKATIELVNKGTIEHDLTIDELNLKVFVAVGKTALGTAEGLTSGTYPFYCSIPGHKEAGMVGTLTVE